MNATLTYTVDGLAFSVTFDRWDALQNDRARWKWSIRETFRRGGLDIPSGPMLAEGDDITTVGEPREGEALRTLASFLGAWCEAVNHFDRTGDRSENFSLFPEDVLEKVDISTFESVVENLALAVGREA